MEATATCPIWSTDRTPTGGEASAQRYFALEGVLDLELSVWDVAWTVEVGQTLLPRTRIVILPRVLPLVLFCTLPR